VQGANLCTMLVLGVLPAENANKVALIIESGCF
jgi:hypothetical protein